METTIPAFSHNSESLSVFGVKHSTNFKVFATIKTAFANEDRDDVAPRNISIKDATFFQNTCNYRQELSFLQHALGLNLATKDAPIVSNGHYATVTRRQFKIE